MSLFPRLCRSLCFLSSSHSLIHSITVLLGCFGYTGKFIFASFIFSDPVILFIFMDIFVFHLHWFCRAVWAVCLVPTVRGESQKKWPHTLTEKITLFHIISVARASERTNDFGMCVCVRTCDQTDLTKLSKFSLLFVHSSAWQMAAKARTAKQLIAIANWAKTIEDGESEEKEEEKIEFPIGYRVIAFGFTFLVQWVVWVCSYVALVCFRNDKVIGIRFT